MQRRQRHLLPPLRLNLLFTPRRRAGFQARRGGFQNQGHDKRTDEQKVGDLGPKLPIPQLDEEKPEDLDAPEPAEATPTNETEDEPTQKLRVAPPSEKMRYRVDTSKSAPPEQVEEDLHESIEEPQAPRRQPLRMALPSTSTPKTPTKPESPVSAGPQKRMRRPNRRKTSGQKETPSTAAAELAGPRMNLPSLGKTSTRSDRWDSKTKATRKKPRLSPQVTARVCRHSLRSGRCECC